MNPTVKTSRCITFGTIYFGRLYREIAASHGFLAMTAPAALGAAAPVDLNGGLPRQFANWLAMTEIGGIVPAMAKI